MVALINLKESLIRFYQKKEDVLRPMLKVLLSFAVLFLTQNIFHSGEAGFFLVILVVSFIQAFLPLSFLYFSGSVLIAYNLFQISPDMCLGFVLLFLICLLTYVRMDPRAGCITIVIPVLFYLHLEYLIPVILGITVGFSGVFPAVFGSLIYYMMLYTGDASSLLINSAETDMGTGLSRVINLMIIDRRMLVLLVAFVLVIFITTLLYRLFYELAWLFSVTFGNAALVFLLLCGRYIFELDYAIWRIFLEAILSIVICTIIQFFRGIGDVSRMERTSFEDDDYIYYVKAVPKIRVAQKNPNVTNISYNLEEDEINASDASLGDSDSDQETIENTPAESGEMRRKRRAERKKVFGRKKKSSKNKSAKKAEEKAPQTEEASDSTREKGPQSQESSDPSKEKTSQSAASDSTKEKTSQTVSSDSTKEKTSQTASSDSTKEKTPQTASLDSSKEKMSQTASSDSSKEKTSQAAPPDSSEGKTPQTPQTESAASSGENEQEAGKAEAGRPDEANAENKTQTFADAVIAGRDKKNKMTVQKLDIEEIVKENIAAAKELSGSDGNRQGKE